MLHPFRALASTLVLFGSLAVVGCDSSDGTPTSPSSPSGTLQVTTPRAILRAGETAPLSVTSGGAPVPAVTWNSSDTSVVSVGPTGQATAGRPGRATVTATAASGVGTLAVRVVPDYEGNWAGGVARFQLTCNLASTSSICAPGAATGGTVAIRLTQVGDQVTGTLVDSAEPTAVVPVTGQVLGDDQLSLGGRLDAPAAAPTLRVEAGSFRATRDVVAATLSGSYTLAVDRVRTGTALQDDYRVQVQFRDLRRP